MTSTKNRLQQPLSHTAPTAEWYAELTVAELRDVVEAFGCELPRGLKRDGVLAQVVLIAAEAKLVIPLLEAMYEDGYGAAIDTLVIHDGLVSFADANRSCGPIDDADSPLAAVVEVGLAVIAAVDGVPSVAMPPVMRPFARTVWERHHPLATATTAAAPAPTPPRRGRPPKALTPVDPDAPAPTPARRGRPPKASLPPPPPVPVPLPLPPRTLVRRTPTTPPEPVPVAIEPEPAPPPPPPAPVLPPLLTPRPAPAAPPRFVATSTTIIPPRMTSPPPRFVPASAPPSAPLAPRPSAPAPRPMSAPAVVTAPAAPTAPRAQPTVANWEVAARRWTLPDGTAISVAVVIEPFYGRLQSQMTAENDVAAARAAVEDAIRRKGMPGVVQVETQGIKRAVLAACPDLVVQVARPGETTRRAARATRPVQSA